MKFSGQICSLKNIRPYCIRVKDFLKDKTLAIGFKASGTLDATKTTQGGIRRFCDYWRGYKGKVIGRSANVSNCEWETSQKEIEEWLNLKTIRPEAVEDLINEIDQHLLYLNRHPRGK